MSTSTADHTTADTTTTDVTGGLFDGAEVIHTYSRAEAISDGVLVDITSDTTREAGFRVPVAMTAAAFADTVEWTEADAKAKRGACQDQEGRLWDVLSMARFAARAQRGQGGQHVVFQVSRIARPGRGRTRTVTLVMHIGPGGDAEPVITIMGPDES